MSGQIIRSHRWSGKAPMVKQGFMAGLVLLVGLIVHYRFKEKFKNQERVHIFTQAKSTATQEQTANEMAKNGILIRPQGDARMVSGRSQGSSLSQGATIQERPLFDGMLATLDVRLDSSVSSASGDSSADASVLALLPGDGSLDTSDGITGAKLTGTFQPNFETERMVFQFRELTMPDGRRFPVTGIAFDSEDRSPGVPADYSSGTGMRILGATLGTAITAAQEIGTTRVLQNQTQQDGIVTRELNQTLSQTTNQAGSSVSDAATRDMKSTKAVLSLKAGTRFRVKLRAVIGGSP